MLCKSYSHFFSKNISVYAIFNDQSFNDTLTINIFSFKQLGPGDQVVSALFFGSQGLGFKFHCRQNSAHYCTKLYCKEPLCSPFDSLDMT